MNQYSISSRGGGVDDMLAAPVVSGCCFHLECRGMMCQFLSGVAENLSYHSSSNACAWERVCCVMVNPPSMRAISSIFSAAVRG